MMEYLTYYSNLCLYLFSAGLKCYVCNETAVASGNTCADPFDPKSNYAIASIVECPETENKFCAVSITSNNNSSQHLYLLVDV